MGSNIFLNPTCDEAKTLRSLIVSPVVEQNEAKSKST